MSQARAAHTGGTQMFSSRENTLEGEGIHSVHTLSGGAGPRGPGQQGGCRGAGKRVAVGRPFIGVPRDTKEKGRKQKSYLPQK